MESHHTAIDLGAESGRVICGTIDGQRLALREIHRFPNKPVRQGESLLWNIPNLILEIKEGLRKAGRECVPLSIGTDSWGVDYVLFDETGEMLEPVHHYRDGRTKRGLERVRGRVEWPIIFAETGIQFMPINTLYQLAAEEPARLEKAAFLLGIADAVNYFLSGTRRIEVSMASTFQLYNPVRRGWSDRLVGELGFPRGLFPEIAQPGERLGTLRAGLASELGLPRVPIIATCSHDTGAAVAGTPGEGERWAYLSSGTWSLMGVEVGEPVINDRARELNFTNEIGFGHSVRLLKNISGMWLIQECRRHWAEAGREFDYGMLTQLASEAPAFRSLINPTGEEFLAPASMPKQISEFCRRTGQPVPESEGAFVRCALESLALLYGQTLRQLEQLTGRKIERLHVVGGGSQNALLNQWTADCTGIPVLAGPVEATAAGNILIQAMALGHVADLAEARTVVRNSFPLEEFAPGNGKEWALAAERWKGL